MTKHPTSQSWTVEQTGKLQGLVASGASAVRAAVAMKRSTSAVRAKARELGTPFPTMRETRKERQKSLLVVPVVEN
jgi:GcrA cell cycle regulator